MREGGNEALIYLHTEANVGNGNWIGGPALVNKYFFMEWIPGS